MIKSIVCEILRELLDEDYTFKPTPAGEPVGGATRHTMTNMPNVEDDEDTMPEYRVSKDNSTSKADKIREKYHKTNVDTSPNMRGIM